MNRGEKFALGAGLVGLAFDGIVAAYFFSPESPLRRGLSLSPPRLSAMVAVMTYGWLLVTWVLVRRAMRDAKRRHRPSTHTRLPRSELAQKTRMTVAGTGLVMLPVQFAMLGNYLTRSSPVIPRTGRDRVVHFHRLPEPGHAPVDWPVPLRLHPPAHSRHLPRRAQTVNPLPHA